MNKEFERSRDKVFAFMESIERDRRLQMEEIQFMNSPKMKMKKLQEEKEKGRRYCLGKVMASMYKNALPLGNDYKVAYGDELQDDMVTFMSDNPMERNYYVTDNFENSPALKRINRSVTELVEAKFEKMENNLEETDASEIKFVPDDELEDNLQKITDDMGIPDVTSTIASNVQVVAKNEIERAKQEKESRENIEKELANDLSITTKESVDNYLELNDLITPHDFKPRLFQGIMIGKTREMMEKYEESSYHGKYPYDAMSYFKESTDYITPTTPVEEAFIESVKEFTKISLLKALKLDTLNFHKTDELASYYSQQ